jgi:hypothetical protein
LTLEKVEVAVFGDVVKRLPRLPQAAVDVNGYNLHERFVHPSPPLDLLLLCNLLLGSTGLLRSRKTLSMNSIQLKIKIN